MLMIPYKKTKINTDFYLNIYTKIKKAHPEECAEKVSPQFVATQTDSNEG